MKRIALCGLIALGLVPAACKKDKAKQQDKAAAEGKTTDPTATQSAEAKPKAMSGEELLKAVEDCAAAYVTWDKEKYRSCFADKTYVVEVDQVPEEKEHSTSPKDVVVDAGAFRNAFPDFTGEMELIAVNGHNVATVGIYRGTHKGASLGMPPTGKTMNLSYGQMLELDDQGKVTKESDYLDQATLYHQLGVIESVGVPTKEESWPQKVRVVAKDDATEKANLAAFKASIDALGKGDFAGASAVYADDATYRNAREAHVYKGPKQIAGARDLTENNTGLKVEAKTAWAAGDWVVAEVTTSGTLAKDIGGVKGTKGKTWSETALELAEFAGGKIKRHFVFSNGLKFAADVGLFDPKSLTGEE